MAGFEFVDVHCHAFRATTYDTPLWVDANRRPGRWSQPTDGTIAQYMCLDPAAPFAEYLRNESIKDEAIAAELRLTLWQLEIREGAVVDLSTPDLAASQRVDWHDLVADDWRACQVLGQEIIAAGGRGVVAPSAALPGSLSVTIFGARSEFSWERAPSLSIQIPARKVIAGAPLEGVSRATRHFGAEFPEEIPLNNLSDFQMP